MNELQKAAIEWAIETAKSKIETHESRIRKANAKIEEIKRRGGDAIFYENDKKNSETKIKQLQQHISALESLLK
jgi:predicted  nucleic acid-binding Zn-ribbon protein